MTDHGNVLDKWDLRVDENGVLTLPPDLLEKMGWKEGDQLDWVDNKDGTWSLRKVGT